MSIQVVNRNNVVAGLFLVGSILLAVAISFILSDIQGKFGSKRSYVFRFSTDVGVTGLKPGADITFGGMSVGKVKSISGYEQTDAKTGVEVVVAHDVVVHLASDLVLFEDAFADLSLPMLGGVSTINIPSAGTGSYEGGPIDANGVLDENEVLRGRFAPSILTQLGFTTEEAEKIKASIDDVKQSTTDIKETTASVKRMIDELEPEFIAGISDGRSTVSNIEAFTANFNGEDGWSQRVDGIFDTTQKTIDKVGPAIDDGRETINEAKGLITDNKPVVARILDNVEQATEQVRFDTMGRLDELLDKGVLALGTYKAAGEDVRDMIAVNRPKIDATLDSVRDTGADSKLLLNELRAQPWRLMQKPSKEDLKREPIYEAARAYASAVSDLRKASEALDAAVGRVAQTGSTASAAELTQIAQVVEEAYGRYEAAEKGLLERLRLPSPSTTP